LLRLVSKNEAMVSSVTALLLHGVVVQAHLEGLMEDQGVQQSMDKLVNKLFEKVLNWTPLHHVDVESTTLAKPGHATLPQASSLPSPAVLRSPAPLPSPPLPHLRPLRNSPFASPMAIEQHQGARNARLASSKAGKLVEFRRPSDTRFRHIGRATTADEATAGETFAFQAEVGRIMDIIVNSIYSDRDVFLRELISNSADAIEKKRFIAITEKNEAVEDLKIRVRVDQITRTLYIEDNGVGMTKGELIENLGRIARSGTAKFTEAMKNKDSVSLIGQFGVGFYSSFLVADQVTVTTRSYNQTGNAICQWQSVPGDFGNFKIKEATGFLGEDSMLDGASSGTQIALKLKSDADEYIDPATEERLLKRFSEFIPFPIELWREMTEYVQVPDGNKTNEDGTIKMKSEPKKSYKWEVMNQNKPLWLRSPQDVNQSEYTEFYKTTFKAFDEPLTQLHFSVEGQIEFRALVYVPSFLPFELNQNMFDERGRAMRLYVKRVFISDKFEDIVPRWLTFLRGVVDSDDLPLNVGREILQQSRTLTVIRKNIVRKVLNFMTDTEKNEPEKFSQLWANYGRYFKVGLVEDEENKKALVRIVRFWSSTSGDNTTSLDQYVSRMPPENQDNIYYVTGDGRMSAEMAPAMEKMKAKNLEVLYLVDPLDEITIQRCGDFDGKKFVDINKGDLDLGETDEEKQKKNVTETEYEPLLKWMSTTLGTGKVQAVKISARLTESPAVLVQSAWGQSPTMQRYIRAQTTSRGEEDKYAEQMNQATLEINPEQPIIKKLKEAHAADPESAESKDLANLVYEIAALTGGYRIDDPAAFAKRVTGMVTAGVTNAS
jgi:heat shock protein beta